MIWPLFKFLGQKLSNFFVCILVETMTPKGHFEITWPLASESIKFFHIYSFFHQNNFLVEKLEEIPICTFMNSSSLFTLLAFARNLGFFIERMLKVQVFFHVYYTLCTVLIHYPLFTNTSIYLAIRSFLGKDETMRNESWADSNR